MQNIKLITSVKWHWECSHKDVLKIFLDFNKQPCTQHVGFMVYRAISTKGSSNSPSKTQQVKIWLRSELRVLLFPCWSRLQWHITKAPSILPTPSVSVSTKWFIFVLHRKRASVFKSKHSSNLIIYCYPNNCQKFQSIPPY